MAGERLLDLVAVMDRLRSPGGCPWDAEQTHASLARYLREETYEALEAIETEDAAALREELGDVLLQVVFHARIAQESASDASSGGGFTIDDVAAGIVEKLVRRHPHVFADVEAPTAAHVEANWEVLKAAEKGRTSALDGVPFGQPALALAAQLAGRAAKAGISVPPPSQIAEPEQADDAAIGDLLFAVAMLARDHGVDPESALRGASRRFRDRVVEAEAAADQA